MRLVNEKEAQNIKAGAGHYHWICRDGKNFTSAPYSTITGAAKAAQGHI